MKIVSLVYASLLIGLSACSQNESIKTYEYLGEAKNFQSVSNIPLATSSLKQNLDESIYLEIGKQLKITMIDCPSRIWPDYNWKKINILMIQKDKPSLVWRGQSGQVESLDENKVPSSARQGLYNFLTWENEPAMSIYVDGKKDSYFISSKDTLMKLIVHEGFHFQGQKNWTSVSSDRGTTYPIDANPRLYRRLIFDRLKTYFMSNGLDQESLGKAAFWFQKWEKEFPEEKNATTDGYEGTARYVDMMGVMIANRGCSVSDEDLLQSLLKLPKDSPLKNLGYSMQGTELALDSEGYDLGGLASLTLRLVQKNTAWYEQVKNGQTPLAILLQNKTPMTDNIDLNLQPIFQKTQDKENIKISTWMDNEIKNSMDSSFARVVFSSGSSQGSYSPEGFYLPKALPGKTLFPLASSYEFQNDEGSITAEAKKVFFDTRSTPCANAAFLTLVPKSDINIQMGRMKITRADLHGEMPASEQTDSNGFTWYCVN